MNAKNFPAAGSLSPLAESILPRSTPRRRFAARSKIACTSESVFVMATHPLLATLALVPSLRNEVEIVIGSVEEIDPTRVGRVRVEDGAVLLGEDAHAFPVGDVRRQ